jgi:glycosyltransferase involved in cell wall biosynthesis
MSGAVLDRPPASTTAGPKYRVMQVTFGMVIGGLERVIMELCRKVDRSRYHLSICCIGRRGPLADIMEAEGVEVIVCEDQRRVAKYLRGFELARIFRQRKVDLIHAHHTPALIDSTIGAQLARIPLITTDHCKAYPTSRRWQLLEKHASRFAEKVVAVSEHSKGDLIRYQGIDAERLQVIYNGLDLKLARQESPESLRRELGLSPEHVVMCTAARLEDQKGLDLLLDAAPLVLQRLPQARFVIMGGGSQEQPLREQAARLGLTSHVIFTGPRVDAVDLIRGLDCFVQTSYWEGMPMALLEAMALRKPIVATAVGGVPEVVADGVTGILVRDRKPATLAAALVGLLSDEGRARQVGEAGYQRYLNHFTSVGMVSQYERLYDWVLSGPRSRTVAGHASAPAAEGRL